MKVTATSPEPQPETTDLTRARAARFFGALGFTPEAASDLATIAAGRDAPALHGTSERAARLRAIYLEECGW